MDFDKSEPDRENDLTALERRLAAWRPATGAVDRDRMLYDAGWAAARAEHRAHIWRLATAASFVVIVTLGGLLAHERSQRRALAMSVAARRGPARPLAPIPLITQTPALEPLAPSSYFVLTAQLAASDQEVPALAARNQVKPTKPDPPPFPDPPPLRTRDFHRILDL
jgi:hypothetical protein